MARLFPALMTTLFIAITVAANEHYLLPERNSDLLYTLKQKIERAAAITIISSELASPSIARSIEKALENGARLHLATPDLKSAAYFSKYKNTLVDVPKRKGRGAGFALNILIIDKSDVCFSSVAFSEALLKSTPGEVICTTNREEISFAKKIEARFVERFEAYNR